MTSYKKYLLRAAALVFGCAFAGGLAFGQTPAIYANGTVNAADYTRAFAPGGMISIFGTNLAASTAPAPQIPLPTSLAGTSVLVDGVAAPLLFVSAGQINAQLPYVAAGAHQVQVKTAAGTSVADTITLAARAPKVFSIDSSGQGAAVATNAGNVVLSSSNPAKPAQMISVYMNSMGATLGNPVAGQPSPQNATVTDTVTATIGGTAATVSFAGLQPGTTGLYRVDIQAPFLVMTGPAPVIVSVGGVNAQTTASIQYKALGYYAAVSAGKFPNGQTLNGVAGWNSALMFRQADAGAWPNYPGYLTWTSSTGNTTQYSTVSGLALTLMNGSSIVYDNNGIESGTAGTFYDNRGGGADSAKPGLSGYFSMSNYFPLVFASYFKLSAPTTVSQIIGYFDRDAFAAPPVLASFDPSNQYVKYRMNIWTGYSSPFNGYYPFDTRSFTGDVFSTDRVTGVFSYSATNVTMYSSGLANQPKPIYRLTYTLAAPITLPAGEYWFAHDASVRQAPAPSSTSALPIVTVSDLMRFINDQPIRELRQPMRFSLLGQEMTWEDSALELTAPVVVRPGTPVARQ